MELNLEARRASRVVPVEAASSAVKLLAAIVLVEATSFPALDGWGWAKVLLLTAAALAAGSALGPWVITGFSVRAERVLTWCAFTLASAVAMVAMAVGGLLPAGASQALLAAAVLSELGPRRHALRWFVATTAVLVLAVVAYYATVPLRPVAD